MKTGILAGPTATGKSAIAMALAERTSNVEIINADSLLFYKGADIGTAKPSLEERARVPHHLIDLVEPDLPFTAGDFVRAAEKAISEIFARGKRPIIVGGSGFYLKALLYGMWDAPAADPSLRADFEELTDRELYDTLKLKDPDAAVKIGPADRYRLIRALELTTQTGKTLSALEADRPTTPDPRFELWVIDREDSELWTTIARRARTMIERGLLGEVAALREKYPHSRVLDSIGYAQCVRHLDGEPPPGRKIRAGLDGLIDEIELATRQLVKSQRTWFKREKHARRFMLELDRSALETTLAEVY